MNRENSFTITHLLLTQSLNLILQFCQPLLQGSILAKVRTNQTFDQLNPITCLGIAQSITITITKQQHKHKNNYN